MATLAAADLSHIYLNVRLFRESDVPATGPQRLLRGADLAIGGQCRFHDHIAPLNLLYPAADFQRYTERRGQQKVHMQGCGEKAQSGQAVHLAFFGAVFRCCGGTRGMAVDEGSDDTPVNKARYRCVFRLGFMDADRFVSIPVAFNL